MLDVEKSEDSIAVARDVDVGELSRREPAVHGDLHRAYLGDRRIDQKPFESGPGRHSYSVARLDAVVDECCCESIGTVLPLAPRQRIVTIDDRHVVGPGQGKCLWS